MSKRVEISLLTTDDFRLYKFLSGTAGTELCYTTQGIRYFLRAGDLPAIYAERSHLARWFGRRSTPGSFESYCTNLQAMLKRYCYRQEKLC